MATFLREAAANLTDGLKEGLAIFLECLIQRMQPSFTHLNTLFDRYYDLLVEFRSEDKEMFESVAIE